MNLFKNMISEEIKNITKKLESLFEIGKFQINKEKRCVFLQLFGEKVKIQCHQDDEFDWKIGLGLAISKLNDNPKYKAHREFFRNKETRTLDIEKYTQWILQEFYHNDMIALKELEEKVNNAKDKEYIEL